jgi:WD40-like Beta Propeller Repeat
MILKFTSFISILLLNSLTLLQAQQHVYPGSELPADTIKVFGKEILSTGLSNRDFAISPTGDEIFFTLQHPKFLSSTTLYIYKENGKWSSPQVAPFSGLYRDLEAAFSADGKTIYFSSDRPVDANDSTKDFDIWKVEKVNKVWGEPQHLGFIVNTAKDEFYPSVTKTGSLYFTVEADYGKGKEDIVMSAFINGHYEKPVSLPEAINSAGYEFNAFIDPDEKYILFTGYGRKDDMGRGDLYIAKKDDASNWLPAEHLKTGINSSDLDYCPFVSWDKKTLFFTSNRASKALSVHGKQNYNELKNLLGSAGNGLDDIYWIKFDLSR